MFLNSSTSVIPTLTGDYPEWHCGREYYSLWYIHIEHPELLAYLDQLRSEFSDFYTLQIADSFILLYSYVAF